MRWFCGTLLGALVSAVGEAVPSVVGKAVNSGTDFGRFALGHYVHHLIAVRLQLLEKDR